MDIRTTIASEINQHHAIAQAKAGEAIHHAKEAGRLLLEVKAALPHGEFGKWLEQNITVSVRQAQRYIAVAEGKQVPIRALASKSDTVSYLTDAAPTTTVWPTPEWMPEDGHWYLATWDNAAFCVVPSLEHPGHFHVSKLHTLKTPELVTDEPEWDGVSVFDGTNKPMKAYAIESMLQHFGMAEPAKVNWDVVEKAGLSRPLGEPESD